MEAASKLIQPDTILSLRRTILRWSKSNYSDFPWRKTTNRWHALMAEVLLQRTKAEQVLPVYEDFVSRFSTPRDYLKDRDYRVFASLGLHWREEQFRKLAENLSKRGTIPVERDILMSLPGIGDYIASAFRSLHCGILDRLIDSNIVRYYCRYYGLEYGGETRRKKWLMELAEKITPPRAFKRYNYGLIDFTRLICTPRPSCSHCPLSRKCKFSHYSHLPSEELKVAEKKGGYNG